MGMPALLWAHCHITGPLPFGHCSKDVQPPMPVTCCCKPAWQGLWHVEQFRAETFLHGERTSTVAQKYLGASVQHT